jgi:hypothetical protein
MGITAVVVHVAAGLAVGAVAGASAMRRHETTEGALVFAGLGALAVSALLVLQYAFWADPTQDPLATFAPDFLSPGRREKILWWYALAAAGIGAIMASAWARIRLSRRQA